MFPVCVHSFSAPVSDRLSGGLQPDSEGGGACDAVPERSAPLCRWQQAPESASIRLADAIRFHPNTPYPPEWYYSNIPQRDQSDVAIILRLPPPPQPPPPPVLFRLLQCTCRVSLCFRNSLANRKKRASGLALHFVRLGLGVPHATCLGPVSLPFPRRSFGSPYSQARGMRCGWSRPPSGAT